MSSARQADAFERRAAQRFLLDCKVAYKIMGGDRVGERGQGKTVNIEQRWHSVHYRPCAARGARVEVEVEWPVKLNDKFP